MRHAAWLPQNWATILARHFLIQVIVTSQVIRCPLMKHSGTRSFNGVQWLSLDIGHHDQSFTDGYHSDLPSYRQCLLQSRHENSGNDACRRQSIVGVFIGPIVLGHSIYIMYGGASYIMHGRRKSRLTEHTGCDQHTCGHYKISISTLLFKIAMPSTRHGWQVQSFYHL